VLREAVQLERPAPEAEYGADVGAGEVVRQVCRAERHIPGPDVLMPDREVERPRRGRGRPRQPRDPHIDLVAPRHVGMSHRAGASRGRATASVRRQPVRR
jgi:hypothetical protein